MNPFRDPCPKALHLGISVTHDQWSHHIHAYPHQTVPEANTHFPATCPPDQRQVPTLDYPRRGLTPGDKTVCEYRLWENDNYPIGKGQREEEARSPPNDLVLEVAEAAVCKIVGINLLRNLFQWIQAMLWSSKQSSAGRTAQLKTTVRVHQRVPDAPDRCASGWHVYRMCVATTQG